MKQLLIYTIVFFLLGSNVVWALDASEQLQEREMQSVIQASTDGDSEHDNSSLACDHCCHGNAHFLGIFSGQQDIAHYFSNGSLGFITKNLKTTSFQPPTPPPNV